MSVVRMRRAYHLRRGYFDFSCALFVQILVSFSFALAWLREHVAIDEELRLRIIISKR